MEMVSHINIKPSFVRQMSLTSCNYMALIRIVVIC